MDIVVAVGLLQLAPKKVTPRVTGAFGFITSLISCYQVVSILLYRQLYKDLTRILIPIFFATVVSCQIKGEEGMKIAYVIMM